MTALTTFRLYASDATAVRTRIANQPDVSREIEYYKENIDNVKSIDDLMNDHRLYTTVMYAYGLEDMTYAKGFIKKILQEGTDSNDALANQLTDARYKELATDFNFARYGETTTSFTRVQTGVIDKFYSQRIEADAGAQNSGARLAIYFQRKSEDVINAYSILGDPALLKFVQTAYSLPESMSSLDIEKQADMINERLDIADLQDEEFMSNLTTRFLALWDVSNPETVNVPPLIAPPTGTLGISESMLNTILSVNFSGR